MPKSEKGGASYSRLLIRGSKPAIKEFESRFFDFLSNLAKPQVFYVRLLNEETEEFHDVEDFFRKIVDPVIEDAGYQRFEMTKEASPEPFLNVEIFKELFGSRLVVADLTTLRPNCLLELGYVLGLKKRVIITAQQGVRLPFDTAALPCHFWTSEKKPRQSRKELEEFIRRNINRAPINE